jgi:serine/threonine-protein kinase
VWLIGGTAVLVVLGICTIISVFAALALIWFSSQTSSNAARATQVVFQRQTEQGAAVTPTRITPTPLSALSTLPPLTRVSNPTQNSASRPAPDQAVRTYYELVGQHRYDLTWPMLTDAFKQRFNCCAPNYNYTDYVSWWDSVNHVEFGDLRTVSQNEDRAVVYVELFYVMNTGARSSSDSNPYVHLVYDYASSGWRFDDKNDTP